MGTFILVALTLLILVPLIGVIGGGLRLKAEGLSVDFMVSSSKKLANTISRLTCDNFLARGHSKSSIVSIGEAKKIIEECTIKCDHSVDGLKENTSNYLQTLARNTGGYTFAMIMAEVHLYSQSRPVMQSIQDGFYGKNYTGQSVLQAIFIEALEVGKQNHLFDDSGPEGEQLTDIPFKVIMQFSINRELENC
jgi:hypothetical protein